MTPPPLTSPSPLVVDCLGRPCPVPVIELAKAIRDVAVGALVEVWSDDPAARHDLPAWCAMRAQDYLGHRPLDDRPAGPTAYLVRRTDT